MKITDKLIKVNNYNRPGKASKPVRICVHYTGDVGTGADRLALYYANVAAGMYPDNPESWTSTQYIVGQNGEVIRIIPDNEMAYAAAGCNNGTIHIEVCYKKQSGEFEQASNEALHEYITAPLKPTKLYRVQVGAFSSRQNADNYMKLVQSAGFGAFIVEVQNG